jgi:GDP-mannose 6-dehydrogenase
MKVAVFGLGYVGTVTAACVARQGHDVWGVDVDGLKVELLNHGHSPVVEPGLDEMIASELGHGRLHATTNAAEAVDGADLVLVCVGTPSSPQGKTDLSYVERSIRDIALAIGSTAPPPGGFRAIVVRSTVPPGTVDGPVTRILQDVLNRRVGDGFATGMCPEFLREGSGIMDFFAPPVAVLGTADPRVAAVVADLFAFLDTPIRIASVTTAEALKFACNAFHATKVSFTNELARLFRHFDVDAREMMELFCEDHTLNIAASYLRPGFAFGGSCLPKDLRALLYLGRMNSVELPVLAGTMTSNQLTVSDIVDRVVASGAYRIALLGLSFKMLTDDLRESPNVELAETLVGKGFDLRIYDPIVHPARLVGANRRYVESKLPHLRKLLVDSPHEAVTAIDLAIVSTSDAGVVEALVSSPPPRLIDLHGRLGSAVEALPCYEGAAW